MGRLICLLKGHVWVTESFWTHHVLNGKTQRTDMGKLTVCQRCGKLAI